jgi:CBS domain-containing protein
VKRGAPASHVSSTLRSMNQELRLPFSHSARREVPARPQLRRRTLVLFVKHILEPARKRLATLSCEAGVCDAAAILTNSATPLAVVCDGEGIAVGVIARIDVVKVLVGATADALNTSAEAMMTGAIVSFRPEQPLQDVWQTMNGRSLRCAPILDDHGRPLGIAHARDVAGALLEDVTYEELLLRDYVLGVGYR